MYTDHTKRIASIVTRGVVVLTSLSFHVGGPGVMASFAKAPHATRLSSNPADLHDAFAPHPKNVETPAKFAQYVDQNDALRRRYARLFNVTPDQVVAYTKHALVPYRLPKARTLTTYGVTRSGMIYPVTTHLKAGAKVWATREGVPILKWNCSNPLVSRLPGSALRKPHQAEFEPMVVHAAPVKTVPNNLDTFLASQSPELPDTGTSAAAPPVLPIVVPVTVASSNSLPIVGNITKPEKIGNGDLWPLLLLPLAFISTGSGSHSTGVPPPGPIVVPPGHTTVPESGSVVLLGCGLGMMAAGSLALRKRAA